MDAETSEFARHFTHFMHTMGAAADQDTRGLTALGEKISRFLGVDLNSVDPVTELFPAHQVVDLDLALERLVHDYHGERFGVSGLHRGHLDTFSEFLHRSHTNFDVGPISFVRTPTGPHSDRRVVSFGVALLRIADTPVVWMQRAASPQYGREQYSLEILCPIPAVVESTLTKIRELMSELSVLRGQVISFQRNDFDYRAPGSGITFLARPDVEAEEVILPPGVLDRVTRHVVEIGEHRDTLLAAGQHLKRGILLYGPPGTGKTHLVRHLLSQTTNTTAVLLSGRTLAWLNDAAKLARATQPAIIVLEDCDLIAEERGGDTNAALFETLEAMDGLDGDADITFILTTNRPDLLERALVERPGRVDLAVQIAKPDLDGRQRLFELYGRDLIGAGQLSASGIRLAAERTEGITASFTKEAIRRTVVSAAQHGRTPTDTDLVAALDEMLSDAETFTRALLGGGDLVGGAPLDDEADEWRPAPHGHGARPGIFPGGPH